MSKFVKSRDAKATNEEKAKAVVDSAPDSIQPAPIVNRVMKDIKETKLVSVPLPDDIAELLENLSLQEDRSQRKIASRLLTEAIRVEAKKLGVASSN